MTAKKPQDHKSKSKRDPYPFEGMDGETYYLTPFTFGLLRKYKDKIEDEFEMMMQIIVDVTDEPTLAALDDLPMAEVMEIINEWGDVGKSDGSST